MKPSEYKEASKKVTEYERLNKNIELVKTIIHDSSVNDYSHRLVFTTIGHTEVTLISVKPSDGIIPKSCEHKFVEGINDLLEKIVIPAIESEKENI